MPIYLEQENTTDISIVPILVEARKKEPSQQLGTTRRETDKMYISSGNNVCQINDNPIY